MEQKNLQADKKANSSRIPRLGKLSRLLLIIGIFAIIFIPVAIVYRQQPVKRTELQQEMANIQKILEVPLTEKERLQAEINKANAMTEVAEESFPRGDPGVDIVEGLFELAEKSDLVISGMETDLPNDEDQGEFPVLHFTITLTGQIAKVQNLLLQINDRYPTSVIKRADFMILESEGLEDVSILEIDISYMDEESE
jgi:cell division protein FtsL